MNRWAGLAITLMLGLGIAGVLFFNLETSGPLPPARPSAVDSAEKSAPDPVDAQSLTGPSGTFREYPVGDPIERPDEHLEIGAVWFPAVAMEGMPHPGSDVIHLEADVKATALNPNGFARGQFVPYLKIRYKI
ncbi:MAG TPA: iron transporter, partial [Isosphaeraceae bacterium]|nr:iron transporter [Isosphaeraceae bacterium]